MTRPLPKLLLTGLMARSSTANPSKYHLPPAELSSHREEEEQEEQEEEVVEEGDEEEVSEVVAVEEEAEEDPTLTLKEETGPVPTALVAT